MSSETNKDIDKTIDLSYRVLAVLWVIGSLWLGYSVLSDQGVSCGMAELHLDTCHC